jgi:hypothetical protein
VACTEYDESVVFWLDQTLMNRIDDDAEAILDADAGRPHALGCFRR